MLHAEKCVDSVVSTRVTTTMNSAIHPMRSTQSSNRPCPSLISIFTSQNFFFGKISSSYSQHSRTHFKETNGGLTPAHLTTITTPLRHSLQIRQIRQAHHHRPLPSLLQATSYRYFATNYLATVLRYVLLPSFALVTLAWYFGHAGRELYCTIAVESLRSLSALPGFIYCQYIA